MKEYVFEIEEKLKKTVSIEAESEHEAVEILRKKYRDEEIVLTADDYAGSEIFVLPFYTTVEL